MADSFDVMDALVALLVPVLYPNGTGAASVSGTTITVFPGWPTQAALDNTLTAANSFVSVFAIPGSINTTRYPISHQRIGNPVAATLEWNISGITASLSGTISILQNLSLIVDGIAYVYAVQATDTLDGIAAALAALIAVERACTSSGSMITIPAASTMVARVGTLSHVAAEYARQKECFQITVWAATPANRRAIQSAIRTALAQQRFLTLPDGFAARLRYRNGSMLDDTQKALLYRYDLFYEIEYATTVGANATQAIVWTTEVFGSEIPPTSNPRIFNF